MGTANIVRTPQVRQRQSSLETFAEDYFRYENNNTFRIENCAVRYTQARNRPLLLLQEIANFRQQFARAVGFRDITVATGRMRFAVVAAQGIGSYRDNRNIF
jgi:hypothetical protein